MKEKETQGRISQKNDDGFILFHSIKFLGKFMTQQVTPEIYGSSEALIALVG